MKELFMINFILVKMRLQIDDKISSWRILYDEYNHKILKYDEQISQTISYIQGLIDEGHVSINQVKQLKI
jgi:hypothetical protein